MSLLASSMRLVDPATGSELVSYSWNTPAGVLKSLDFPTPTARDAKSPRSGAHGTVDSTRWSQERAITAVVWMPPRPNTDIAVDNLSGLTNPGLRLWMYVQRPDWPSERRILVRGATFTCPPAVARQAQAAFVSAGSSLFEDVDAQSVTLEPSGTGTGGRTYPRSYPRSYAAGVVSGAAYVTVGGNAAASFVVDMYGPCSDPTLLCVDTGEQLQFTGLTLNVGDFLRVDTDANTARLNGLSDQSRTNKLNWSTSTWFSLPAGRTSQLVYSPTSPSGNCQATVTWRSKWF